jgi:hypothetical protein
MRAGAAQVVPEPAPLGARIAELILMQPGPEPGSG